MNVVRSGRGPVPIVSGTLLVLWLVVGRLLGSTLLGDLALLAAAIVAGGPIGCPQRAPPARGSSASTCWSAWQRSVPIVLGELWEAAAVTFLFAVGHALEAATLNRTRSALAELVAVAPDVAVVLDDGQQVERPAGQVRRARSCW